MLRPLNVETLSTYIYQFATRGNFEEGALAALLIVGAGILPVIWIVRLTETAPAGMPPTTYGLAGSVITKDHVPLNSWSTSARQGNESSNFGMRL